MDLNRFMSDGVKSIITIASRYYLNDSRGRAWLAGAAIGMRKAQSTRDRHEAAGLHVPPYLIASISSDCNLYCIGCYARANGTIAPEAKARELSDDAWGSIFDEADELGVSFILLAGGEPTLRRGVIERAATHTNIAFPVFTNGVFLDDSWIDLFDEHRNLIPVFSIEGDLGQTDARRGEGVAARVHESMEALRQRHVLWGVSITVTVENVDTVSQRDYVADLHDRGCGLVIYNEYVPISHGTEALAMDREGQKELMARIADLQADRAFKGMILYAFPGDEENMGGCLAAGRGFFHISQSGGAEPCPFSPISVANVTDIGIRGALESPFFARVREVEAAHSDEHLGGCTLFLHHDEVLDSAVATKDE